jgi:hypothetical protein
MTPDPYKASGGPPDPQSWNQYAYTRGDPVNRLDPNGLDDTPPPDFSVTGFGFVDYLTISIDQTLGQWWSGTLVAEIAALQAQGGGGGTAAALVTITNLSTTSAQALGVQNSLRMVAQALKDDPDCSAWLASGGQDPQKIVSQLLGEVPNQADGSSKMLVGVGNFSDPTVSAVAGTAGTNLPVGSMGITVSLTGGFFTNSNSIQVGQDVITGGTDQAKAFTMLHELAHLTGAAGFLGGDYVPAVQNANNSLLEKNCGKTMSTFGFEP